MQVSYIDRIKGYLRFMKPEIRAEWKNRNKFIFNDKHFIDQLIQSNMIISSALHGIILAESYGIPTIYLKDNKINKDFKFNDYYSGTGRSEYKYANTIEDAFKNRPVNELPNFDEMRKKLFGTFPYDLWENYQ